MASLAELLTPKTLVQLIVDVVAVFATWKVMSEPVVLTLCTRTAHQLARSTLLCRGTRSARRCRGRRFCSR